MGGFNGEEDKDYVQLKNVRIELGDVSDGSEEGSGCFSLFFWLYIVNFASLPSTILAQRHTDATSWAPFLSLDEKKKLNLFPLLFLHKEALDGSCVLWSAVPVASTEFEFPLKKWVHVGCQVLRDVVRLFIDGEMVGESILNCLPDKDLDQDVFRKLHLACPNDSESLSDSYVHGLEVLLPTSSVKGHRLQDPPVQLCIDYSSASEIEDDSGGVWSIVGGKASCRRIFSMDVTLSDVLGRLVKEELEVVASLLYAENDGPVENNTDGESPLLSSFDGIEHASCDRPAKLISGRASFKLKISQLSSKSENRLFRIKFHIPGMGGYPFLETLSPPIRCISRSRNAKPPSLPSMPWRRCSHKGHDVSGCQSPGPDQRSVELIPNIIREAKPSPSSKRIKLGHDKSFAMFGDEERLTNKGYDSQASAVNKGTNSSVSNSVEAVKPDPPGLSCALSPVSDLVVFKYCLAGTAERFQLLKEVALSATEEEIAQFSKHVSLFSGCSHHRHQIKLTKRLVEEGIRAWTCLAESRIQIMWEDLAVKLNECFMKIACCHRPLLDRDLECLRRIGGCQELVSQENFEKIWAWLYPVAFTLSRSAITPMWDSLSPLWMEGFITKEKAESILKGSSGLQDAGTFILRFPTSRRWPHPDAGSLVVTYVAGDSRIRHRIVSFDFIHSAESVRPLQDLLLEEPELSRLGRMIRSH